MKTRNKALLVLLSAMMLVAASVFGTMAYLTDTDADVNTFTVGQVGIELDETDVKTDGTQDTAVRVKANEYHLIPGHTYIKDPTVTVEAGSEDAYVRMMVQVDDIENLKNALPDSGSAEKYYANGVFLLQMLCVDEDGDSTWKNGDWIFEEFHDGMDPKYPNTYEFRYVGNEKNEKNEELKNGVVVSAESATKLPALFEKITVPGEIDNTHLAYLENVKIIVTAHAMQADGFDDAETAWTAFDGQVK